MPASLTPGFMVLQGNQLEDLRNLAVHWLRSYPLRPLEQECILVQSNGIAQWLKMALASDEGGCGVAAAMELQLPGRFVWQAYRSVFPELPTHSPFDKAALGWRLYTLLAARGELRAQLGEDAAPLEAFLAADDDPQRCNQLASRLADLYDQYQLYRADWLEAWEAGRLVLIDARGQERPLPAGQRWQARLWCLLTDIIRAHSEAAGNVGNAGNGDALAACSRARIHREFIRRCADFSPAARPPGLPRRVIVFSISSLPRQTLELLQALSPFTQVMVFASNPSQHYWGDLIEGRELLRQHYRRQHARTRPAGVTAVDLHAWGHPLLASWGKQSRDFLHLLDEHDQPDDYRPLFAQQKIDLFSEPAGSGLLQQLQGDILHLRSLEERQALASRIDADSDDSLQFTVAHSAQREVEILHDQLLDSFARAQARGAALAPRDILVMVPDIDLYAPHIHAVFGRYREANPKADAHGRRDPRHLPYHISDQSERRQNTLLIALDSLLQLPQARFTVSQLADLLDTPALRTRFGIAEADLPTLRRWIRSANIRWGLDEEQRRALGLPALGQNSWLFGLQRMLLGYAAGDRSSWRGIESVDAVGGLEAALLGPLAALIDALQQARLMLDEALPAERWLEQIEQLLAMFFSETSSADRWALDRLQLQLEQLAELWQQAGLSAEILPLEVVRDAVLDGVDTPTLSQKFLGGSINFATLMPMRAIPFRQLWLLGMNDGDYPRRSQQVDFDLMAQDYRPGDRSRREDDRYLFLEALLSARERLVISWVGHDIRDNSLRPASVLVNQLRDHIAAGWTLAGAEGDDGSNSNGDGDSDAGAALLAALTTVHPLQAFSRRYFEAGHDPRLFTHAHEWRALHDNQPSHSGTGLADLADLELPPWQAESPLSLADLASFLRRPVPHLYRKRLGIYLRDEEEEDLDREPFTPDSLQAWSLRDTLVDAVQAQLLLQPATASDALLQAEIARLQRSGSLPPPPFGEQQQAQLAQDLAPNLRRYQALLASHPQRVANERLRLEFAHGLVLEDSLSELRSNEAGERLRVHLLPSVLYRGTSKKYEHLIGLWPAHLAAQLQAPTQTRILGSRGDFLLPALDATVATTLLGDIVAAYREGMARPLPLTCKTAFAMLEKSAKAAECYEGGRQQNAEMEEAPVLQRLWPDYEQLSGEADFHRLAEALYRPLIDHLVVYTGAEASA